MLGIGFGRKDRGGRMKRGLGRLSGSAQIDLLDVFATLSKAIGILDRLDNDKQRILVGNAAVERLDGRVYVFYDELHAVGAGEPQSGFSHVVFCHGIAGTQDAIDIQRMRPRHGDLAVNQSVINSRKLNHRNHLRT